MSDPHKKSKMTPVERLGIGLGVLGIGIALFVGLPPPWWPDMPPIVVRGGVALGIVLICAGASLVVLSAWYAAKRGRKMLPLIGMAVSGIAFLGCVAWYFWPKSEMGAASISDQEKFRRMMITVRLRDEYLKSQPTPSPMVQAGLENPPASWFNKRLRELGEEWQIQPELKLSSDPGLFVECHLARFPLRVPSNGQVYALNLNALPLENGGGGIAEYSSQPDSEMNLGPQITMGQRCVITNHGARPIVNVVIGLNLLFQEQVKDRDTPNASRSGRVVLERPWRIDIKKIDPSPGSQFEFYIWNMTTHFASISFLGRASAEYIGSSERFEFHVSSSNPYPIHVNPLSEIQAAPKSEESAALRIHFESRLPYTVSEVTNGRAQSTVKIGLKATGKTLSNCKVYIEKIAPEPKLAGGLPILLDGGGFVLRPDDPEKLVEVATQWNHLSQFRFSAPIGGAYFAETLNYLPDNIQRTIEIKVVATELQRTALFKIWTDESKKLHLEPM